MLFTLVTMISASPLDAQSQTCRIPGFPAPTMCARAGLDTVHARYTILVDESGSMKPVWAAVKAALHDFVDGIPSGDELSLVAFSGTTRSVLERLPITNESRGSAQRSVDALPEPTGAATDLGSACSAAAREMRGADPSQLQLVFILTDGRHQPPPGSPYSNDLTSAAWRELSQSSVAAARERPASVWLVRLAPDADPAPIRTVFPAAMVIDKIGASNLRQWFTNVTRDVAVEKLRTILRHELEQPAAEIESPEPLRAYSDRVGEQDVRVTSFRRVVTTVPVDAVPISISSGGSLTLRPEPLASGSRTIGFTDVPHGLLSRPGSARRQVSEKVVVRTQLEPHEELGRIGIPSESRTDTLVLRMSVRGGGPLGGWAYYGAAALLTVLALGAANTMRKISHHAYLGGRVIVRSVSDSASSVPHALRDRKLKTFTIPSTTGAQLVHLEARNENGRTAIVATPVAPDLTVAGRPFRTPLTLTTKTTIHGPTDEITYLPS